MPGQTKPVVPKLDLRRQLRHLFSPPPGRVVVVDVPQRPYLMVDGVVDAGVPPAESPGFVAATAALYAVAYGVKFASKQRETDPLDFTVLPLEGLWAAESGEFAFGKVEPWLYTLLIMQPDHVTDQMVGAAVAQAQATAQRNKQPTTALEQVRLQTWEEGRCIQVMHVGPYADEPATIAVMDAFAEENGYSLHGRHHEIYLGDPRRSSPETLKTVLRHPVLEAT